MDREYLDYVEDIINEISLIENFVKGMTFEQFLEDEKTSYAVIRALEIIGEASKKIPEQVRLVYQEIPWREMSGMRDKLIHDYFGVNLEVVWKTVQEDLKGLIEKLQEILS